MSEVPCRVQGASTCQAFLSQYIVHIRQDPPLRTPTPFQPPNTYSKAASLKNSKTAPWAYAGTAPIRKRVPP